MAKKSSVLDQEKLQAIVAEKERTTPGNPGRVISVLIADTITPVREHSKKHDTVTIYVVIWSTRVIDGVVASELDDVETNLRQALGSLHAIGQDPPPVVV